MVTRIHLDSLVPGESLVATEPAERDVARTAERIAAAGLDTPLVAYAHGEAYVVADDNLRLAALRRLYDQGRLDGIAPKGFVDVFVSPSASQAAQTAADRVIRNQLCPAAQAIYAQRLLDEQAKAGPNCFGIRHRSDGQVCPPNQQPGPVGWLSERFDFSLEWTRQTHHCTRIPSCVLHACLSGVRISKAKLVDAGRRIYENPDGDAEQIAWDYLFVDAGDNIESAAQADDDNDGEQAAKATSTSEPSRKRAKETGNRLDPLSGTLEECAERVAETITVWQKADQQTFWQLLVAKVVNRADADAHALAEALKAVVATAEDHKRHEELASLNAATVAADAAPSSPDTAADRTGPTRPHSARAHGPNSTGSGTTAPSDPSAHGNKPALAGAKSADDPASGRAAAGASGGRTANTGIGQPNEGPRGGVCNAREAGAYREWVQRLTEQYGTQTNVAKAAGIPPACLSALMNGRGLSRANAARLDGLCDDSSAASGAKAEKHALSRSSVGTAA